MFRKSKKQRTTARYSVSDFSKLGAMYSHVSRMAKLRTRPFAEVKKNRKIYHERAIISVLVIQL